MRDQHTFEFSAEKIAAAANNEALYHRKRIEYWQAELESSMKIVKDTASLKFEERDVTGGTRMDMVIHYGDPGAHQRMYEAASKIDRHRQDAERYETEARVYGSQSVGRMYELASVDVLYFRLGGQPREE